MAEKDKLILDDRAIDAIKDDKFGFKEHAKRLARLVAGTNSPEYISVGISGSWGSGKSSMLNLVKCYLTNMGHYHKSIIDGETPKNKKQWKATEKKLRKEMPIVVEFDPWFFGSEERIIQAFFDRLAKATSDEDAVISRDLKSLSKCLGAMSAVNPAFSIAESITNFTNEFIFGEEPKDFFDIKERLKKNLNSIDKNKRIVVLIDDMDRLQADETLTMLKIIRLVTDLPRINTIVAFDQEATAKTIEKRVSGDGLGFIKKMINVPTYLPRITNERIMNHFTDQLLQFLVENNIKGEIKNASELLEYAEIKIIREFGFTLREVKNILNLFIFNIVSRISSVDWRDFLLVCILFYFYPDIFENLKDKNTIYKLEVNQLKGFFILDLPVKNETTLNQLLYENLEKIRNNWHSVQYVRTRNPDYISKFGHTSEVNINIMNAISPHSILIVDNHDKYFSILQYPTNKAGAFRLSVSALSGPDKLSGSANSH